jgi:hypothetical protein
MNEKTTAAPKHDSLRDLIGQAISDEIAAGAEQPDWCDSREIDRLADAVMAVLSKRRTTLSPERRTALDDAAKTGATVAEVPGGGLVFINRGEQLEDCADLNCSACGGSGHADDAGGAPAPAGADDAFAAFCDREGFTSDGQFDAALRKAFDAGHAAQPSAHAVPEDAIPEAAQQNGGLVRAALIDLLSAGVEDAAFRGASTFPQQSDYMARSARGRQALAVQAQPVVQPIDKVRANFEHWYTGHARDLKGHPIGSYECALMWAAFLAGESRCYAAPSDWKISPQPWGIDGAQPVADAAPVEEKPFAYFVQPSVFGPFIDCESDQLGAFPAFRAPQPSTAQGDALSKQSAPSAQQERAWFKHWLAGLEGNITVDQVEFGRRVWAERARRATEGGA